MLGASSASAAWGGKNGKVIFWDFGVCCDRIWWVNPDGSDLSLLLEHSDQENDIDNMDIAPDGSALLFYDNKGGYLGLLPFDPLPSVPYGGIALDHYGYPHPAGLDRHASFSRDGNRILWVRYPGTDTASAGVWVINRDGSDKRQLVASTTADDPRWSPDGTTISYQDTGTTYTIAADGSGLPVPALTPFPPSPGLSPISPDGRKIAFVACCDADTGPVPQVYVSNLDGSDRVRLTDSVPCYPSYSGPCPSPYYDGPLITPGFVHWQTLPDPTPPVIQPTVSGPLGNNGWYTGKVSLNWSVDDPESNIASTAGCATSSITADTAALTLTCTATNRWGTSASSSVTVKRDATPPTAFYTGNAGVYATDQPVKIGCLASDPAPGSGSRQRPAPRSTAPAKASASAHTPSPPARPTTPATPARARQVSPSNNSSQATGRSGQQSTPTPPEKPKPSKAKPRPSAPRPPFRSTWTRPQPRPR
jgi:hypothetical protein